MFRPLVLGHWRIDTQVENRAEWKERKLHFFSHFSRTSVNYSRCSTHERKQQGPMARSLFRNAHILDVERGDYLPDSSVLVEGDRILELGGADLHAGEV